ncbi:MAG: NAD(P)H-dependent oxidoreductase, partial [Mollicutes bacterium]|nr:NAD(P)H-dependent oxidoreductase [Mollicutes bacterium]
KYIEADVIIFSFPLYGYAVPSHLKAVMDRFIPLNKMTIKEENGRAVHERLVDLSKKQAICIVGSGFPNFNDNFAGLRIMLDNYFLKKEINIFVSETPMLNVKEAEPLTINLKNNMFIAGKEFIESGSISKELIKKIEEPMLDFNTYTNIVNSL